MGQVSKTFAAGLIAAAIGVAAFAHSGVASATPPISEEQPAHRPPSPEAVDHSNETQLIRASGSQAISLQVASDHPGGAGPARPTPPGQTDPRQPTTTTSPSSTTEPTADEPSSEPGRDKEKPGRENEQEKSDQRNQKPTGPNPTNPGSNDRPAGTDRSQNEPAPPPEPETVTGPRSEVYSRLDQERSFLSTSSESVTVPSGLADDAGSDVAVETQSVMMSWLMDRDLSAPSMVALSPVLVLLTIWDAAASAGSGLAAPASGLGTFVLLVLLDRSRLSTEELPESAVRV